MRSATVTTRNSSPSAPDRLRALLAGPGRLVMPCCFDALSARLIEQAGFPLTFMSGFAVGGHPSGCAGHRSDHGVPADIRTGQRPVHGIQIWLALPAEREEMAPAFHYPADALPAVAAAGVALRVLIGAAFGQISPVVAYSPTSQIDAELAAGAGLELPPDGPERGVYLVEGRLRVAGTLLEPARASASDRGRAAGSSERRIVELASSRLDRLTVG